jgi:methionine-rich copper-binding protein CopC
MFIRSSLRIGGILALALSSGAAFAHAQLDSAQPPVGGTVSSPAEIRLKFTEGLEPKYSGLAIAAQNGAPQQIGAVGVDPSDNSLMIAKVAKRLPPGVYTVKWHAVSVDTHHTQGAFNFTVK